MIAEKSIRYSQMFCAFVSVIFIKAMASIFSHVLFLFSFVIFQNYRIEEACVHGDHILIRC